MNVFEDPNLWSLIAKNLNTKEFVALRRSCSLFYHKYDFSYFIALVEDGSSLFLEGKSHRIKDPDFWGIYFRSPLANKKKKQELLFNLIIYRSKETRLMEALFSMEQVREVPLCVCSFDAEFLVFLKYKGIKPELECTGCCGEMTSPYGESPCVSELIRAFFYIFLLKYIWTKRATKPDAKIVCTL